MIIDDMLIATKNLVQINSLKTQLSGEFEMKDLGAAKKKNGNGNSQRSKSEQVVSVTENLH